MKNISLPAEEKSRLNEIQTNPADVKAANEGCPEAMVRQLRRYGRAIILYLRGRTQRLSQADASEIFDRVINQFLEGKLVGWDPSMGRFRDFLKGVIWRQKLACANCLRL